MSKRALTGGIIAVMLITTFFVWYFRVNGRPSASESLVIPSDWKHFSDPHGYVSLQIPPTWNSKVTGGSSFGGIQGSDQLTLISYLLQDAQANAGGDYSAIRIKLSVGPWTSDAMRRYMCQQHFPDAQPRQVGTLMGEESNNVIDLLTQRAYVRIAYTYPGAPGITSSGAMKLGEEPTPVSDAERAAGKHIIDLILSSFRAIPNQSMTC